MSKVWGAIWSLACVAFFEVLLTITNSHDSKLVTALGTVGAVLVGAAVGIGSLALVAAGKRGLRSHWEPSIQSTHEGELIAFLRSTHWHTVRNLRVDITGPGGLHWSAATDPRFPTRIIGPGQSSGGVELKEVLGAHPTAGEYFFYWRTEVEGRGRPVTLAKMKRKLP